MRKLDIIPIIGHGSTNLIDIPIETLIFHLSTAIITYNLNFFQRKAILLISSIKHISHDIFFTKYKIPLSLFLHLIWLKNKNIAIYYLNFIHTPLHYYKSFKISKKKIHSFWKINLAIITTFISFIGLNNNIDLRLDNKFGQYWWVSPILGHIISNEYTDFKVK